MDPVTAKVGGIEPAKKLDVGESIDIPGSGKRPWKVKRCNTYYTCSCGAFQTASGAVSSRTCAHLRKLLGDAYESARIKLSASPRNGMAERRSATFPGPGPSSSKRKREDESDYADYSRDSTRPPPMEHGMTTGSLPTVSSLQAQGLPDGLEHSWFSQRTTFNGRQLRKDFDASSAIPIMLSETWKAETMDPTGWWMTEKLDGVRAYWTGSRLISRTQNDWKAPKWFLDKLPQGFALDGELWRERDGFEELSGLCQRSDPAGWATVNYFVFDAPDIPLPYEERVEAAKKRCPDGELTPDQALRGHFGGRVATLPMTLCKSKTHLEDYMNDILAQGGEGVVLRRRNSPYERKRSTHSRKYKKWYDGEGVVVGYSPGTGRFKGMVGSVGLVTATGIIFTVGSGLPDSMRSGEYLPPKGALVRYRCGGVTSDGWPRFPVWVGQVHDRTEPRDPDVPTTALRKQKRQDALDAQLAMSLLLEDIRVADGSSIEHQH